MIHRPSKPFIWWMTALVPILGVAGFGIIPNLDSFHKRQLPGDLDFRSPTPTQPGLPGGKAPGMFLKSKLEFQERVGQIQEWKHLPSVFKPAGKTARYHELQNSADPFERALASEIERLVERRYERLMKERYPELAVTMKNVPDERNGYLKWIEFLERRGGGTFPHHGGHSSLKGSLKFRDDDPESHLTSARDWLKKNAALVDEIRAIGLLTDQSARGISVNRWPIGQASQAKNACETMLLEARLAVSDGDIPAAIRSVAAARGIARLLVDVETPTMLEATVAILLRRSVDQFFLQEILPSLPPDQVDVAAWEAAIQPRVETPAEFARIIKGEWSFSLRRYILPLVLDSSEKNPVPDPGDFIDAHSVPFAIIAKEHETAGLAALPPIRDWTPAEVAHLSREYRSLFIMSGGGSSSWRTGWQASQSDYAFTLAAFALMKGEVPPPDPVSGLPFIWNPDTRMLSMPAGSINPNHSPVRIPKLPGIHSAE